MRAHAALRAFAAALIGSRFRTERWPGGAAATMQGLEELLEVPDSAPLRFLELMMAVEQLILGAVDGVWGAAQQEVALPKAASMYCPTP